VASDRSEIGEEGVWLQEPDAPEAACERRGRRAARQLEIKWARIGGQLQPEKCSLIAMREHRIQSLPFGIKESDITRLNIDRLEVASSFLDGADHGKDAPVI
jgi:hypothetical protein